MVNLQNIFVIYLKEKFMENNLDIVVCITSYNRFKMVKRLVDQLLIQQTTIKFKILLFNDGSTDENYNIFKNYSDKLTYLHRDKNGGKSKYYQTINILWSELKKYNTKFLLQTDDDFILCPNFLNTLMEKYLDVKEKTPNISMLCPHTYSFKKNMLKSDYDSISNTGDGISLIDIDIIKKLNYSIKEPLKNVVNNGVSVGFWQQICDVVNKNNNKVFRLYNSLVFHDNTGGSVMHGDFRNHKFIFTQNFEGIIPDNVLKFNNSFKFSENIQTSSTPNNLKEKKQKEKELAKKRMVEYERMKKKRVRSNNSKKTPPNKKPRPNRPTKDHTASLFTQEQLDLLKAKEKNKQKTNKKEKNNSGKSETQKIKVKKKLNINLRGRK